MKLYKRITTATAAFALLVNSVAPVFAADLNLSIVGNGSDSDSEIEFENENSTGVFQTNQSSIQNQIVVNSNTGDNEVEDNTGGDVHVETGDVTIEADVYNEVGSNYAQVDPCDDCDGDTTLKISGNGTDSDNEISVNDGRGGSCGRGRQCGGGGKNTNSTLVVQENASQVDNRLDFSADTGDNEVEDNTGGSTNLNTGDITIAPVEVTNVLNANMAMVGGNGGGSDMDLLISGNGSNSENEIEIEHERELGMFQLNASQVLNELIFDAETGDNDMEDNTGETDGDPSLETGDITVKAYVDTATGFNVASADCGCEMDVEGSIMENGTDSENEIELEVEDELLVTQDNLDSVGTGALVESDTGDNDVEDNTAGEVNVKTGNADHVIETSTMGGSNVFGDVEFEFETPWGVWGFFLPW